MTSVDRIQGLSGQQAIKTPCRLATTAAITLSGEQTLDGVAAVEGDRVLVKDQADTTANGVYDVSTGSWTRSLDFDGANDIADGTMVLVGSGSTNADLVFKLNATEPITIGTTALTFTVATTFTDISAFGATLLDDANAAAARTTLGVAIGTDVQAYNATLAAIAAQTEAANKIQAYSADNTPSLLDFKDEDDMASNSATAVSSQQSVKAYVDAAVGAVASITLGAAQASTSGVTIDFTSIPAGTKRITVLFKGVSTNGVSPLLIQIGDAGGVETSGYVSSVGDYVAGNPSTAGFILTTASIAADNYNGAITLALLDAASFSWVAAGVLTSNAGLVNPSAGSKALSAELDRVRVTTVNGTDAFDAGTINILYE